MRCVNFSIRLGTVAQPSIVRGGLCPAVGLYIGQLLLRLYKVIISFESCFNTVFISSGLDSSASTSLIALLNSLARGGRTLVATIHQPSALLFEKIDSIYCLAQGRTLFKGARINLLPALQIAGLRCPAYHNPADFCKLFFSPI